MGEIQGPLGASSGGMGKVSKNREAGIFQWRMKLRQRMCNVGEGGVRVEGAWGVCFIVERRDHNFNWLWTSGAGRCRVTMVQWNKNISTEAWEAAHVAQIHLLLAGELILFYFIF